MSLYARQAAWLNARPRKDEAAGKKQQAAPEPSRRERLQQQGVEQPDMPPCDCLHLVGYLFEIGPTVPAGMGEGPLTHTDLAHWMRNTGIALSPWESRALRRASKEYLSESQTATERNAPSPWESEDGIALQRAVQASSMRDAIRGLAKL